jgi:hypothetical protein
VHREEQRVARLREWVEKVLGHGVGSGLPGSLPSSPSSQSPQLDDGSEEEKEKDGEGTDESSDDEALDMNLDLSALVVHEQCLELCTSSGEEEVWVPARLLLSVDLWLHVWTADMPAKSVPKMSIPLAQVCLRPVAERSRADLRVVYFAFRPPVAPSLLTTLSAFLRGERSIVPRELRLRCEDVASSGELLAALELVEKLYPIV